MIQKNAGAAAWPFTFTAITAWSLSLRHALEAPMEWQPGVRVGRTPARFCGEDGTRVLRC